jgi:hypothetical protein
MGIPYFASWMKVYLKEKQGTQETCNMQYSNIIIILLLIFWVSDISSSSQASTSFPVNNYWFQFLLEKLRHKWKWGGGGVVVVFVWKLDSQLPVCNQCLSPLKLWVQIPPMARCTRYNIMWYSLLGTCCRSMVFSGYSGFLHQ